MRAMNSRRTKAAKSSPRRREQKVHRQEEILAAAFEVFAAHGYEAARIDDVARQAGIAKGTIYLYFRDKEQLFRAVVRSLLQKRFDAVAGGFKGTAEQLLRELLSRMYSQVVRNEKVRSIVRLLIAESGRFPQLAEIYHREIIAPGMKAVRQALSMGSPRANSGKPRPWNSPSFWRRREFWLSCGDCFTGSGTGSTLTLTVRRTWNLCCAAWRSRAFKS